MKKNGKNKNKKHKRNRKRTESDKEQATSTLYESSQVELITEPEKGNTLEYALKLLEDEIQHNQRIAHFESKIQQELRVQEEIIEGINDNEIIINEKKNRRKILEDIETILKECNECVNTSKDLKYKYVKIEKEYYELIKEGNLLNDFMISKDYDKKITESLKNKYDKIPGYTITQSAIQKEKSRMDLVMNDLESKCEKSIEYLNSVKSAIIMQKDTYKRLCNSILDAQTRGVNKTLLSTKPLKSKLFERLSKIEDILRKEEIEIFDETQVFNELKSVIDNNIKKIEDAIITKKCKLNESETRVKKFRCDNKRLEYEKEIMIKYVKYAYKKGIIELDISTEIPKLNFYCRTDFNPCPYETLDLLSIDTFSEYLDKLVLTCNIIHQKRLMEFCKIDTPCHSWDCKFDLSTGTYGRCGCEEFVKYIFCYADEDYTDTDFIGANEPKGYLDRY